MFDSSKLTWSPEPIPCSISDQRIEITTRPKTDLWQRTFADFSKDNAPVLQMKTGEQYFIFTAKASFEGKAQYDQCGLVMHQSSDTWFKASIECENEEIKHLGSVATNHGYSDWACTAISATTTEMWYRMTRSGSDFLLETSADGEHFHIMRMFHMDGCAGEISFGVYACSPGPSTFTAVFTGMDLKIISKNDLSL